MNWPGGRLRWVLLGASHWSSESCQWRHCIDGRARYDFGVMTKRVRSIAAVAACMVLAVRGDAADGIRFNEIQVIGTHNSYHIAPEPAMMALIERGREGRAASIDYTHRPLWEQFALLGIRQIELDVFADPKGGHYAMPGARALVKAANLGPLAEHDPQGRLKEPGLKVLFVFYVY